MSLHEYDVLTFDCYGTLIDWETGLLASLRPLTRLSRRELASAEVLTTFARAESEQEAKTPSAPYPEVLAAVHRRLATTWGIEAPETLHEDFGRSVGSWPAFVDSEPALAYLKRFHRLVILSNVDRASFAQSNDKLGVEFDAVYTAEDIGSYKPDPRNFAYLIRQLERDFGVGREGVLHVAQSVFHDHVPAREAGLATCWIDRRAGQDGWGATAPPAEMPALDYHFPDLASLVRAHRAERE